MLNDKNQMTHYINDSMRDNYGDMTNKTNGPGRRWVENSGIKGYVRTYCEKNNESRKLMNEGSNLVVYRGRSVMFQKLFGSYPQGYSDVDQNLTLGWFAIGSGGALNQSQSPLIVSPYKPGLSNHGNIFPSSDTGSGRVCYIDSETGEKYYQSETGKQYKAITGVTFLADSDISSALMAQNENVQIDDGPYVDQYLIAEVEIVIQKGDGNYTVGGDSDRQFINELGLFMAEADVDGFPVAGRDPQIFCKYNCPTLTKMSNIKYAWGWNIFG